MSRVPANRRRAAAGIRRCAAAGIRWRAAGATGFLTLLSACAVGPDFKRPDVLSAKAGYVPGAPFRAIPSARNAGAAGQAQNLVAGADVSGEWWKLFGVPELDALVARALAANPSLDAAKATLRAAWEQTKVQASPLFPSITGEFNPTRNKTARSLSPVSNNNSWLYNLHTLQLNISYTPDLWGGQRRGIEQAAAQADLQRFQIEAVTNTLVNTLIVAVIQMAALQAQIEATESLIASQRQILATFEAQFRLGDTSLAAVMAQRSALAQSIATLPALKLEREQAHDQIAALVGVTPDESLPEPRLDAFHLPATLPVSLPAQLLEQRPDVRAAEAQVQAASAQVGIAIANRLPNIQLIALPGEAVNSMSQFFKPGFGNWELSGMFTQPLFQGFQLMHLEREARHNLAAQAMTYRDTVLKAVENVADTLHALQDDADALRATAADTEAANRSFTIARSQQERGDISPVMVQTAQQTALQARLALIQAQSTRYSDCAALFQALGGGWWHRDDTGIKNPPVNWKSAFTAPG
ncbi:efflux transporter outer membrane subunit [Acidomonas methanolica]|uniref:efflux transporter outer membrane subunit n=1 Tax=Acidomonas methanolica TaxID=437 RepID=UPI001C03D9FE|nr:efflux transporter outer membrane subunit [Acidomonas methanolica]MBU2654054.1 efflux transporter outer membrane subunit [Acidomonas methanolica]